MEIVVQRFEVLDSTNLEAARQIERGAREGACVVAREQTHGRGRQQRVWLSAPGAGLYLSLVLRPRFAISAWPLLTLMAAVAVADTLEEAGGVSADIKWPNDLLVENRKICGILAETVETPASRAVVLGIGINLKRGALPEDLRNVATALEEQMSNRFDHATADHLLGTLLKNLSKGYATLGAEGGTHATLQAWTMRSTYAQGKSVRVACGPETIQGITRGLNPDGALRLETTHGDLRILHAGDVEEVRMNAER
ncbi:MAG: biotin--[acetyl-CoA-carboxylase] ligase [Pyrinomonadaceae bacterium]